MTYSHLWNKYFKIHDLQLSAPKVYSKLFEILLVKILLILLVTKYIRQHIEQINFFYLQENSLMFYQTESSRFV